MILRDFHVHTTFSDGKNTPEETVLTAINKGMDEIGFSDHSYTFFDESYCCLEENVKKYINEILLLKEKYKNKIKIHLGVEQDYYSQYSTNGFEYIIGSVHYLKLGNEYVAIDKKPQYLIDAAEKYFNGDFYKLIAEYYNTVANVIEKTNADIIGHFDLIAKFNENNELFDESDSRYIHCYMLAVDKLLKYNKLFEINTGPVTRGYRTVPFPNPQICEYIKSRGGKFILSSDSHSVDTLTLDFDKWIKTFSEKGIKL